MKANRIILKIGLLVISLLILQGCRSSNDAENMDAGDHQDSGKEDTPTACVDRDGINQEVCEAICTGLTTKEACESTTLPPPDNAFIGHGCLWYKATETHIAEDGTCTFGEERYVCGYAFWDDIWCRGSGMKCGDAEYPDKNINASYFEEDGRVFLIKSNCSPDDSEFLKACYWVDGVDSYYLKHGIPECECGCSLETEIMK